MSSVNHENLALAMLELEENEVIRLTKLLIDEGINHFEIQSILNDGIKNVGKRFEQGEYFIADLIVSGIIYQNAIELFQIAERSSDLPRFGLVVIGVVENDIHDIGKNIICEILRAEGFEVIDLGVDVSPSSFVKAVRDYSPDVLAMSGVMGFALESMHTTIQLLEQNNLRAHVPVIIGGTCITSGAPALVKADAVAINPMDTIAFCKAVMDRQNDK